jgi:hypothetical protein
MIKVIIDFFINEIKNSIMYKVEGFWNVKPKIKKVGFPVRGKMQVNLEDGRSLLVPTSAFPSIKKCLLNSAINGI